MKQRILTLCILFLGSISVFAQVKTPDPKTKKNNKIGINTDRIEFGYKEIQSTSTTTSSNGRTSSFSYLMKLPLVKVNDSPPMEIHFRDNTTSSLFKNCPVALNEFKLAKTYRKKAIVAPLLIFGVGGLLGLTGFVTSIEYNKPKLMIPTIGIGLGSMITGALMSRKYSKKSTYYLEGSFATYNSSCYKPIEKEEPQPKDKKTEKKKETTASANTPVAKKPIATDKNLDKPSTTPKKFEDEYTYKSIRNNPTDLGQWNIALFPIDVEAGGTRGLTMRSNASISYFKGIQYGVKATFGKAYFDNWEGYDGSPVGTSGIYNRKAWVTNYKKQTNFDIVAFKKIASKTNEIDHSKDIGRTYLYGHAIDNTSSIKLNVEKSWLLRGGYHKFDGLVDGYVPNSSLTLISSDFEKLDKQSAAMLHTSSIAIGAAYRNTSDYKIKILEGALKGDKENSSFGEIYADVLYSPIVKYDSILYGFETNVSPTEINTNSPKSRLNFRIGYESNILNKRFGTSWNIEVGSRPGTVDYRLYGKVRMGFLFGGRI
jgi:hypothetical protein